MSFKHISRKHLTRSIIAFNWQSLTLSVFQIFQFPGLIVTSQKELFPFGLIMLFQIFFLQHHVNHEDWTLIPCSSWFFINDLCSTFTFCHFFLFTDYLRLFKAVCCNQDCFNLVWSKQSIYLVYKKQASYQYQKMYCYIIY